MPDIWSLCHSSNVWVVLLSILLTAPVICAPNPGFVLPPTLLAFTIPCNSCLEHIPEAREHMMHISTALHHSYMQIKIPSLCCVAVIIVAHSAIAEQWKVWIEPWRGGILVETLSSFMHLICCSVDCCRGCISLAAHGAERKPCKQTLMRMCTSLWISEVLSVI